MGKVIKNQLLGEILHRTDQLCYLRHEIDGLKALILGKATMTPEDRGALAVLHHLEAAATRDLSHFDEATRDKLREYL